MNESALYRKYRPRTWKDVVGQEHIVKVLQGSIELGNIAHAYLFAGTRGTGKTTIARIFAREIGCNETDVYEIDAASNNGVDEVRALNEAVLTLPYQSPYKVYILDEAHMLSKAAFNALLKTLEEPPKHVVFILATTETDKLPETVVSRCQVFSFRKPSQKILKDVVLKTAKKEGFAIDSAGAELVALLGDGSFRDTHGILQKVISSSKDKKISIEEIESVTGAPRGALVNDFIAAVNEGNKDKGLKAIAEASKANIDTKVYLKLILNKMRSVLLLKNSSSMDEVTKEEVGEEDYVLLKAFATDKNSKVTSATLLELLNVYDQVSRSSISELPLELALIKLTSEAK